MMATGEQYDRAFQILRGQQASGMNTPQDLALACALLTSPIKAEREQGKALVREWKKAGVSHAKPNALD